MSFLRRARILAVVTLASLAIVPTAFAQNIANGRIRGHVGDTTGASLPGVTVTAASPALLVGQVTTVSDVEGVYTFPDLPVGIYTVSYELPGFQRLARQDIRLSAAFTAEVNVSLAIGSVQETITVAGASPVVDTTSTTPSTHLSNDYLVNVLPSTRRLQDVLTITPGITTRFASDLGGGTSGGGSFINYGITGQSTMLLDGVNTRQGTTYDEGAGNGPDMGTIEDFQIVTVGGGAEQALPGAYVNMIVKSGGNDFHGRVEGTGISDKFQNQNISKTPPEQGLTVGDAFKYSWEGAADLGGRLVKDKLWFYGATRRRRAEKSVAGYAKDPGPDKNWLTDADNVPAYLNSIDKNYTIKETYQLSPSYKLIGLQAQYRADIDPYPPNTGGAAPRLTPYPGSVTFGWYPAQLKAEFQGTPSNRLLFNFVLGRNHASFWTEAQPGQTGPRTYDFATQLNLGPALTELEGERQSWGPSGSLSYFPASTRFGRHEFKVGGALMLQYVRNRNPIRPKNYLLYFNNGAPIQFATYDYPVNPVNSLHEGGMFASDTWRLGDRTTLNLGARWDHFYAFAPEQTKEQGQFGTAGTFPQVDAITWDQFAPRAGVAIDLFGNGKTVAKASWGLYNQSPGEDFAGPFNRNAATVTTYAWTDPNGNGDYDPGEVNLNPNLALGVSTNSIIAPNLKDPHTQEAVFSVDRELAANVGARLSYIYIRHQDLYSTINVLRPLSAWNVVVPRTDPGVDGITGNADDGGIVNVYDYDRSFFGSAFIGNQRVNRPGERDPKLYVIEGVLSRRQTGRWSMLASTSFSKNDRFLDGIVTNPNQNYFDKDTTWDWEAKVSGSYELPYRIALSGVYQAFNGVKGQRTFTFTGLPQSSTFTVRLEPYGKTHGPVRDLLNLRAAREFSASNRTKIRANLEVLNVMNSVAPWTINSASGPQFLRWGTLDSPRLLRGTVSLTF